MNDHPEFPFHGNLLDMLRWFQRNGSSVSLGWGEGEAKDNWELSWIDDAGQRWTGIAADPRLAALEAIRLKSAAAINEVIDAAQQKYRSQAEARFEAIQRADNSWEG